MVKNRILGILILVVYMASAIGISFSFHYCGGEVAAVSVSEKQMPSCCDDEEESDGGCCQNKTISAKIDQKHLTATPEKIAHHHILSLATPVQLIVFAPPLLTYKSALVASSWPQPPPLLVRGLPLFKLFRVFRI